MVHYRRTLSKSCFWITNTHAPLYSIIAPSAPALGGSFKSERFFSPHPTWLDWRLGHGVLKKITRRDICLKILPYVPRNSGAAGCRRWVLSTSTKQCRVGAEPMQLAKLPPANNFWCITVERFQKVVFGLQTLTPHCILSSLHPRPPSVGVSKANAFSAPTLHSFLEIGSATVLGDITCRGSRLKFLLYTPEITARHVAAGVVAWNFYRASPRVGCGHCPPNNVGTPIALKFTNIFFLFG